MPRRGVLAVCLALFAAPAAHAFTCGARIIDVGDSKADVLEHCGAPVSRDQWDEELIQELANRLERRVAVPYEEWIYDRGPLNFIFVIGFREDVIRTIETRGYGHLREHANGCDGRLVDIGDTRHEVTMKCGEPDARKSWKEDRIEPLDGVHKRRVTVVTEHWTYRSGGELARTITFVNRRVTRVHAGEHDPSRP